MVTLLTFSNIVENYGTLTNPVARIEVNGIGLQVSPNGLELAGVEVELTSGFESSCASYRITNCYNVNTASFNYKALQPYIMMGSSVTISLGYNGKLGPVFKGYIARVEFNYDSMDETAMPYCEVTCLDVKGIMMSNNYHKQLMSKSYGAAVTELFNLPAYAALKSTGIIGKTLITPTPDAATSVPPASNDKSIDLYDESDYEFVVRAAKRYNYDFYVVAGEINFRPTRLTAVPYLTLKPVDDMRSISVVYDIAGMVGAAEARNMDPDKGIAIKAKKKMTNKLSAGPLVKAFVPLQSKTIVDPSIRDTVDATGRLNYIMDNAALRFGTVEAEFIGIPDFPPACYVSIQGLGDNVSNDFYVANVKHIMNKEGYITRFTGRAPSLPLGL